MTETRYIGGWRLALAALLVLLLGLDQWRIWRGDRLDTDLLSLLPEHADSAVLDTADARLAELATDQFVVVLGSADRARLSAAEAAFRETLAAHALPLAESTADALAFDTLVAFYRPWRDRLLTAAQHERLAATPPDQLAEAALARLLQPLPSEPLGRWQDDPLGLFAGWWAARAAATPVRPEADGLRVHAAAQQWAVLAYALDGPAFAVAEAGRLGRALDAAEAAALAVAPDLVVHRAGVPLHADAAAAQAAREVSTIGLGASLLVLALVLACFGSLRPLLLIALSLAVGLAVAMSLTVALFGRVHVLTLVFGASLLGVAVDYGLHWFAARQVSHDDAHAVLRRLRPSLLIAIATSALAYAMLAITPFPGVRQMAVFAASGLLGAGAVVVLLFPALDRRPVGDTRLAVWLRDSLPRLPRLRGIGAAALVALVGAAGAVALLRMPTSDDLRQLQNTPPRLAADHAAVAHLLRLPSPAQFVLVSGADPQQLLHRDEQAVARLRSARSDGLLDGWQATSDWLPSRATQDANRSLVTRAEAALDAQLTALLGEALPARDTREASLDVDIWLAGPTTPAHRLWLGEIDGAWHSLILLHGLRSDAPSALAAHLDGLDGVHWVDRTADYGRLLQHYRERLAVVLLIAYAAVALLLALRFGRDAWRAWLPAALASLLALALLAVLGQPLQLFHVLALLVLLGIGVDYGLFLLARRSEPAAWLAVVVGVTTTLAAFGLLALSATPALHAFGLTLLIGLAAAALFALLFRLPTARDADAD